MTSQPCRLTGRVIGLATLVGFLTLASGCGSGGKSGTVTGKVTYKGQPLAGAHICFVPAEGAGSVTVFINEQGVYKAENVPVGKAKICFYPPASTMPGTTQSGPPMMGKKDTRSFEDKMKPPPGANITQMPGLPKGPSGAAINLPKQYTDADKSGLTYDVQRGEQNKDFDLS